MDENLHQIDIQPTDRVVFVHIPKTAGTTFNAILEPVVCGMPCYPQYNSGKLLLSELEDLRTYRFFRGHFPYRLFSEYIFPEGFIGLTCLREPVSRTISNFHFFHQLLKRESTPELSEYADELEQVKTMTLVELLENIGLRLALHFKNTQTRFMGDLPPSFTGFAKSCSIYNLPKYHVDSSRLNLDIAKARLAETAFFGITERFQDSLFLLSYTFGWRPTLNKLHLNPTSERNDKINMSPTTLASIQGKVSLDLELYEFGQDLFEKRFNDMTQILLQHYGMKEHAALKLPLPSEVMMQLLEQHFLVRRDHRYQHKATPYKATPLGNTYCYSPSMHVEGPFGWYALEHSPTHGATRWSGPGLESGFDLPCPSGENIQISFCILMALQLNNIEHLCLTANNVSVALVHARQSDGSYVFTGQIPSQAKSGPFIRLVISVPQTIAPCSVDSNNKDMRLLGVFLNWVKLTRN